MGINWRVHGSISLCKCIDKLWGKTLQWSTWNSPSPSCRESMVHMHGNNLVLWSQLGRVPFPCFLLPMKSQVGIQQIITHSICWPTNSWVTTLLYNNDISMSQLFVTNPTFLFIVKKMRGKFKSYTFLIVMVLWNNEWRNCIIKK